MRELMRRVIWRLSVINDEACMTPGDHGIRWNNRRIGRVPMRKQMQALNTPRWTIALVLPLWREMTRVRFDAEAYCALVDFLAWHDTGEGRRRPTPEQARVRYETAIAFGEITVHAEKT